MLGASRANVLRARHLSSRNRTLSSRARTTPFQLTTCKSPRRRPRTWSSHMLRRTARLASKWLPAPKLEPLSRTTSVVAPRMSLLAFLRLHQSRPVALLFTVSASIVALRVSRCQAPQSYLSSQATLPTRCILSPCPTISLRLLLLRPLHRFRSPLVRHHSPLQ